MLILRHSFSIYKIIEDRRVIRTLLHNVKFYAIFNNISSKKMLKTMCYYD